MSQQIINVVDEYHDEASSSSDEDEDEKLPKEVYSEKSPLLPKTPSNIIMVQPTPVTENEVPRVGNKKWTQYLAAIVATLGGFIMGTTLGWTAPSIPMMKDNQYPFQVTEDNISLIAAFMPIGALLSCPIMGVIVDKFGRKTMMLLLTIPTIVGWATIIGAKSVLWIYAGRVLTGFASGSYSLVAPVYVTEIAEKEIRGKLGTYFQVQVNAGILFTYAVGYFNSIIGLSIACAIIPMIYILGLVAFIPESPVYYIIKGNIESARSSLKSLRGTLSDVTQELNTMQLFSENAQNSEVSIMKAFQTTPAKRGLYLGLGMMFFQQFTGCNAVIFYATTIFKASGSTIQPNLSTVIVGVMAVTSTYISTLVVDKLGRRILLLYSVIAMGISTFIIGGYFYGEQSNYDVSYISFILLIALCIYIIMFSMGFGPIPWIVMGEIFPSQIKGVACSIVCMSNWIFVFLITGFFSPLVAAIHIYNTFWLFTLFSILGTFFVLFIVPETKNKTFEEIQKILGADQRSTSPET